MSNVKRDQPIDAPLPKELPSPLMPLLADSGRLIEIIAGVLNEPPIQVRQWLREEETHLGCYQVDHIRRKNITPHVWSDELVEFYRTTYMGILGNVAWNRRPEKLAIRDWIGRRLAADGRPLDILTIGDGSGFDSLYLAMCGHRVTYSEESRSCIAFARALFSDAGVDIQIAEDVAQLKRGGFDAVVCLDVLEHVPDPPALVAQLVDYLRPGGKLVVHAPFFFVTWHNPTHLASNRRYSGDLARLYGRNGLRLIDGRFFWDPIILEKRSAECPPTRAGLRPYVLRVSGLLLAVGRWWNWPHNAIGVRAMQNGDPRWLEELSSPTADVER
jgi:2-polyprenyl-3-methyl-5-hydroxy-6-metoxy-1,4-benzoquinol methylase